ncbi:MAG: cell division/cell wall cluster transcriptional repressor MraZ [Proteobacteria bacterium]|nr:MAG: cell division/cell wall cluster transcriptional repressor MraZ [Pseudomonadota bacterium]
MLLGSHSINMDSKGRIAIPTRVREQLNEMCGGRIVVTAHPREFCVIIYPQPYWDEILPKIIALPDTHRESSKMKRLMMGHVLSFDLDASGRVSLSSSLREYGKLTKKLKLIGQGNKLELWGEEAWNAWMDEPDDGEMPEEMRSLTI